MITNKKYNINGINTNIVLISDIHYYNKKDIKRLNKVYDNINKIKPNFICIPGDILDSANISDIDLFISWLTKLSYISKIIITLGNHEYYVSKKESIFKLNEEHINKLSNINNVYLLRNNNIIIDSINFIGLELPIDYYMKYGESIESFNDNIKNIKGNKKYYNILLCHSPVCVCNKEVINKLNVDLILCGHMHGGMIPNLFRKIFNRRGLISPTKKLFPNNIYGHIKINNTNIIITSGIKVLSNSHFKFIPNLYSSEVVEIKLK